MTDNERPPVQLELPLPFPELSGDMPLLPARMINEYQYCPRLAYLEWVQGEWAPSADTVEGDHAHRRVDKPSKRFPEADELDDTEKLHGRSITLSSNRLGLIAKLDLIEAEDGVVTPIDYKRGKRPHVARGAYDPERVQLCVQAMVLREHGYVCEEGALYYVQSRERVRVAFDDELQQLTANAINGLRLIAAGGHIPNPLRDSPKCAGCSLVGICLPDEVNYLRHADLEPRPLAVMRDEALPVYVQAYKAKIGKKGEELEISIDDEKVQTARLVDVSQVVVMGNVYITTPCLQDLMKREIPVSWHSYGGWFVGHTVGTGHKNVELRTAQYKASFDDKTCLAIARNLVRAKIQNSRTLARRNWRSDAPVEPLLEALKNLADKALRATDLPQLLGIEGGAAAQYFAAFDQLIKKPDDSKQLSFDFNTRNRRPPTDPVNALLSFAYAMLTRTWTMNLSAVGLDPYRGFYHQPRYGRPALALDLMEPFRPIVADSTVLQVINNGEVRPTDFVSAAGSVNLNDGGRKRFIAAFERRMSQEITHPLFGYKVDYRRLFEIQARLFGRYLLGELPEYPNFTTR
ncbi:CRISPR-associated endonuclease Cas1 [Methylomonas sp. EFPC3]|uniref:CRISPR-associated endonuclease Cas4g/Cas1g n=1 Tax=Methylomonas sp. EFPC3 TaxID=3021710 RepID=UPI002417C994|nr:CRISPR-associated endonuclease Cas1 [Methylomonas sp. EFPC3]WFP50974.1 CRISPR-associated endonuclease Cas1 [Methylomonas sp. EFPC3]